LESSITTKSPEETRDVGVALGKILRAGDLVLLNGGLGAGKTTFTQGIAHGLGVDGRVTSPTFIVAREHSSSVGPGLVHVDAYRIEDGLDLETLDLTRSLDSAVTVIEWGKGKVEALSESRLEVQLIAEDTGSWEDVETGVRTIVFRPIGKRWEKEFNGA
jgi:ATPase, YjeE family